MRWDRWLMYTRKDQSGIVALLFFMTILGIYWNRPVQPDSEAIDFTCFLEEAEKMYQQKKATTTKKSTKYTKPKKMVAEPQALPTAQNQKKRSQPEQAITSEPKDKQKLINNELEFVKSRITPTYRSDARLDVNATDALDWEALPGIGPYYSKLITNYREKLGGFSSINQVGETWRLPDSTFQKIRPLLQLSPIFRFIQVNSDSEETLKAHPYINWRQAKVLVNFRQNHNGMLSLADFESIPAFEPAWKEGILPYLQFEQPLTVLE